MFRGSGPKVGLQPPGASESAAAAAAIAPAGTDFEAAGPDFEAAGPDFEAAGPDFSEAAGPDFSEAAGPENLKFWGPRGQGPLRRAKIPTWGAEGKPKNTLWGPIDPPEYSEKAKSDLSLEHYRSPIGPKGIVPSAAQGPCPKFAVVAARQVTLVPRVRGLQGGGALHFHAASHGHP